MVNGLRFTRSCRTLGLWVCVAGCCAATAGLAAEEALTVADVAAGLRHRESMLENAAVHTRMERLQRVGIKDSAPLAPTKLVIDQTWDKAGRVQYSLVGQMAGKGRGDPYYIVEYNERVAFDGGTTRRMRGESKDPKSETLHGEVSNGRHIPWPVDPREFDSYWYDEPVSKYLGERTASIRGTEEFDGHKVLLCEVEYRVEDGFKPERKRLWIDPARGFIVVKKEGLAKPTGKDEWVVYGLVESTDHVEAVPGIWLPRHGVYEHYIGYLEGKRRLWNKIDVEMDQWKVNQPLADNDFKLDFVPKINVVDNIRGKTYRTQGIDDVHLDAQAARAQELVMEFDDMRPGPEIEARLTRGTGGSGVFAGLALWGGLSVLTGGVLCVGYYLWRSRKRAA